MSIFEVGDRVRCTLEHPPLIGVVRRKRFDQHIDMRTGELVDFWSWGYVVDYGNMVVYTAERFLEPEDTDAGA